MLTHIIKLQKEGGIFMDMNNIVEQIALIKEKLSKLQEELSAMTVEGTDSKNIITAILDGKGKVLDYKFNVSEMIGLNQNNLVEAVVEATNNALKSAKELEASKKKEIVGDVNIPDMPGLF